MSKAPDHDRSGAWRLPRRVYLVEDDRRPFLDLDEAGHRTLLRHHLDRVRVAVLGEAAEPGAFGWCDGRAHEVVVPLKATRPPAWPTLPAPTPARAFSTAQMQTPAASSVLLATLYGDARRQDTLLSRHLPDLLERLGGPPWWFIRFRDPEQHLRLRIALPTPEAFTETARTVSAWADEPRGAGLLADKPQQPPRATTTRPSSTRTGPSPEPGLSSAEAWLAASLEPALGTEGKPTHA